MMQKTILSLIAACLLANVSQAAVFERDLVSGSGDGLLTYDDVNQREWLDLTESILENFDAVNVGFEGAYQNVIAETMPGGVFAGFMSASGDDVIALAQSAGIDTSTRDFATNEIATRELVGLLGPTATPKLNTALTTGLIAEINSANNLRIPANISFGSSGAGLTLPSNYPGDGGPLGVYIYRNAIPEPTSLALASSLITYSLLWRSRWYR